MRIDEAALLTSDDMKNDGVIPFFDLTASDKVIKNIGSARQVPIIPHIFNELGTASGRLFPRFKVDADGKAQSAASKACMTFIRKVTTDPKVVVHSLRATLKDRLRDAGVQKEINDFITGHGSGDVAGSYGSGSSLKVRYEALCKVDHPWLERKAP
jgi:integrase